jgi:hypothetical protein
VAVHTLHRRTPLSWVCASFNGSLAYFLCQDSMIVKETTSLNKKLCTMGAIFLSIHLVAYIKILHVSPIQWWHTNIPCVCCSKMECSIDPDVDSSNIRVLGYTGWKKYSHRFSLTSASVELKGICGIIYRICLGQNNTCTSSWMSSPKWSCMP